MARLDDVTFSLEEVAAAAATTQKDLKRWVDRLPCNRSNEHIAVGRLTIQQATAVAAGAWFGTRLRHRTAAAEAFSLLVVEPPSEPSYVVVKDGRQPTRVVIGTVEAAFGYAATRRHIPLVFEASAFVERLTGGLPGGIDGLRAVSLCHRVSLNITLCHLAH